MAEVTPSELKVKQSEQLEKTVAAELKEEWTLPDAAELEQIIANGKTLRGQNGGEDE